MPPCCNDSNSNNMIMGGGEGGGVNRQMISYTEQVLEGKTETNRARDRGGVEGVGERCLEFSGCTGVIYNLPHCDRSHGTHV